MKKFALIGAAGYIAPRHLAAIKATGNELSAALDKADNVGILDSYFPDAAFFTDFERFQFFADMQRRAGAGLDYVAVVSPNYLHAAHIGYGLRSGASVICEKPLVLDEASLDVLAALERETGQRLWTILQLRLHPVVIATREKIRNAIRLNPARHFAVKLTYITARGHWYFSSWKADPARSGGIVANIGIHFFDMLSWIFGDPREVEVDFMRPSSASGRILFDNAQVDWRLSLEQDELPASAREAGKRAYRSITINGEEVEFSEGFTDLHTLSYREILEGRGFGIEDARTSIALVDAIRKTASAGIRALS